MKRGFTLIELLAVIVILAIIALIAVPIVLNIINDSKESSGLRSAEFYLDAVEYTIADAFLYHGGLEDKKYPIDINGDICKIELDNQGNCPPTGNVSNTLKVEVNGDKPTGGYIEVIGGNISNVSLVLDEKTIIKDDKGDLIYQEEESFVKGKLSSVCKAAKEQLFAKEPLEIGYKYECDVDPNKEGYDYMFYVLNSTTTEVNLIMDSNITSTGIAIKEEKPNDLDVVAWYETENNSYGPITAMNYLQTATAGWTNTNELTINKFTDDKSSIYPMSEYIVNARMPYYNEIDNYDRTTGTNAYLYDYLSFYCSDETGTDVSCDEAVEKYGVFDEKINHTKWASSYWSISRDSDNSSTYAWHVSFTGDFVTKDVCADCLAGVRAVINLKI